MRRIFLGMLIVVALAMPALADFKAGLKAAGKKDYATALEEFRRLAKKGHAGAQFNLGLMYHQGLGVKKDYAEARRLYRIAAKEGNPVAANNVGMMYKLGHGVEKDNLEAVRWFRKAAEKTAIGKNNLAAMYLTGAGVLTDYEQALRLFRAAAVTGHGKSQYDLALMYDKGIGTEKDAEEAERWMRKAANRKYAKAVRWLKRGGAADVAAPAAPSQSELLYSCPRIPPVSWWGSESHQGMIETVTRKYRGDWPAYTAKWDRQMERMMDLFARNKGAAIPRDRVDVAKGEIQREGALGGENVFLSSEDLALYIPKLVQRTAVIRCLARGTAEAAEAKKIRCPPIPEISWWGNVDHQAVIAYVDRKHGGDWKPYVAKWESHLEKMTGLFDKRKGAAIPRSRVDLEKGEIQREGAAVGEKVILGHEDLGLYIGQLVQRTAVHRCLANALKPPPEEAPPSEGAVRFSKEIARASVETPQGPVAIERIPEMAAAFDPRRFKMARGCPPYCIQPQILADGVTTVGELETIRFLAEKQGIAVDTRLKGRYRLGTLPGAVNIYFRELPKRLEELGCKKDDIVWDCSAARKVLLFCDGPLGSEADQTVRRIRHAGFPADKILYYRGGVQTWSLLGLTVTSSR